MPVLNALNGSASLIRQLQDGIAREQAWSEKVAVAYAALIEERNSLRDQIRVSDEMLDSLRADFEIVCDELAKHGLHPERVIDD